MRSSRLANNYQTTSEYGNDIGSPVINTPTSPSFEIPENVLVEEEAPGPAMELVSLKLLNIIKTLHLIT